MDTTKNKGLEFTQNKDMRIAWLSIFSSLCNKSQHDKTITPQMLKGIANKLTNKLYKKYPFPKDEVSSVMKTRIKKWLTKKELEEQQKANDLIEGNLEQEHIREEEIERANAAVDLAQQSKEEKEQLPIIEK